MTTQEGWVDREDGTTALPSGHLRALIVNGLRWRAWALALELAGEWR